MFQNSQKNSVVIAKVAEAVTQRFLGKRSTERFCNIPMKAPVLKSQLKILFKRHSVTVFVNFRPVNFFSLFIEHLWKTLSRF